MCVCVCVCLSTVPSQPSAVLRNTYSVLVKNPEVVFVADLTRPDAPALVMTTQVEAEYHDGPDGQRLTAGIRDLKVTACPFLRQQRKPNHVTTVLQPCQLFFSLHTPALEPQRMELSVSALTLKVRSHITLAAIKVRSDIELADIKVRSDITLADIKVRSHIRLTAITHAQGEVRH